MGLKAQYCGFDNVPRWLSVATINDFTITDVTDGATVVERLGTGYEQWATVQETGTANNPIELNIGNSFEIDVNIGIYFRGYLRAYIDKNQDQRFDRSPIGPDEEFIANNYVNRKLQLNVGEDVPSVPQC